MGQYGRNTYRPALAHSGLLIMSSFQRWNGHQVGATSNVRKSLLLVTGGSPLASAFSKAVVGLCSTLWVCGAVVRVRRWLWGPHRENISVYPWKVYTQRLHPGHFPWGPESPAHAVGLLWWTSWQEIKKNPQLLQIQLYYRLDFSSSYRLTLWSLWPLYCCCFSGATPDGHGFKLDHGLTSTGEKGLQKVIKRIYSFFFPFFSFPAWFHCITTKFQSRQVSLKALKSQSSSTY